METDSYTGEYTETIVKSLINKNAGYLASEDRQIPNLATAEDLLRGEQTDYSARYKDLSTEIHSLLASRQMGLQAGIDFDGAFNENSMFHIPSYKIIEYVITSYSIHYTKLYEEVIDSNRMAGDADIILRTTDGREYYGKITFPVDEESNDSTIVMQGYFWYGCAELYEILAEIED